jgi:tetratricopeptide (TPR) repeat protein
VIGRVVGGRFQLAAIAGSGGMGTVYRSHDLVTGATVAVKMLTGREEREVQRFDQEAAIMAGLTHPAIVRYLAHGIADGGERFIAMEWLDGEDLCTRLERGMLTIAEGLAVARRAAEALAYAHGHNVLHRDVKPENLFLPGQAIERLKVLDFGIARLARGGRKLTLTGRVIGTPGYMAPEIVRGDREITARADVFSLGCVTFLCLAGRPAFEAEESTALLAKILLQDAPRLREVVPTMARELDELLARMLAKDPARRLPDAEAVIAELDALPSVESLGAGARAGEGRRRGRQALTASERRIACVVIAGPSRTAEQRWRGQTASLSVVDEAGLASSQLKRLGQLEDELARAHGVRMHPLPDGAVVLTLPDAGKATDQAAQAARCAIAMRAVLPEVPLVVSSGPGRFSAWSVVGEVIDNGMRLLRATPPGMIRLDDVAVGLLDARFEIRRDGTESFLRGERDFFEARRALLGKATPFVGRGREMSMLTDLYAGAAAEAIATAVIVVGPAGVGKSRLRQEFVEWVRRQPDGAEVLFGTGDSLGAGSPFAMLGRAIRRTAGILEGDTLEARREKLCERVARHVDRDACARVAAFLGELAHTPFPDEHSDGLRAARGNPQLMGDAMRRAWEDWLAAECAAHPVVLVLEDLHWGDLGTASLVDASLRTLRDTPFMVVALARDEIERAFPNLWQARAPQMVRLGPLSKRASEKLVREALADADDATVDRIVARADGNAFYLEELVRATAAGRADALPDSVLGMVQARLDAEGPESKRVLRAAAVFGERFSRGAVAALLGGEAEIAEVSEVIERLASHELVARAPTIEGRSGAEFSFAHALVREAAYAMLTDEDRQLGHRLAGAWLEQAGSGDAMALAEHFRRGDELGRAVPWFERAAADALRANDLAAAIARAEIGIASGAAAETAGRLRLIQAEGHVWRGELAHAEARALEAASTLPPGTGAWLRAQGQAIIAAAKHGRLDVVETQVRLVGETPLAAEAGALDAQVICLSWAANYLVFGGRTTAADALLERVGALARPPATAAAAEGSASGGSTIVGAVSAAAAREVVAREAAEREAGALDAGAGAPGLAPQALALVHQARAARAAAAGDLGRCLTSFESALHAFEMAGDMRNACAVRTNLGYLYCELGDLQRAEAALRQALVASDRMGLHDLSAAVEQNLGRVVGLGGAFEEGERLERRAMAAFARQGDPRFEGAARWYLAEIMLATGRTTEAEREAGAAAAALAVVAPSLRVAALGTVARARLTRGDAAGALEAAREAHQALEQLGELDEGESMVRLVYVEALAATGARDESRQVLAVAQARLLARAEKIGEPAWRHRFLHDVPVNARLLALGDDARTVTTESAPPASPPDPPVPLPRLPTGSNAAA